MDTVTAYAPGKAILVGEHAVVYNRPAIAVPVSQVQAQASVTAATRGLPGEVWIDAPNIGLSGRLKDLPETHSFVQLFRDVAREFSISEYPALRLKVTSSIPIAAGLGSGAAISVATIRALAAFFKHPLSAEQVSALAYEQEKIFHGTPSGIDNTVIAYEQPIYFVREQPFVRIGLFQPFTLVIADTGIKSSTATAVGGVRQRWQREPETYQRLFNQIGHIARLARSQIEKSEWPALGTLLNQNHLLLQQIGVSCPELDGLVETARQAGAWGAKLSGGGQGGNMIALVDPDQAEGVALALRLAGAVRTWITHVQPKEAA